MIKSTEKTVCSHKNHKKMVLRPHLLSKIKPLTFKDAVVLWQKTCKLQHKGATEAKYDYLINRHILPSLSEVPLKAITALTINEFTQSKLSTGRIDKGGHLSPAYVRSMVIIINSVMQFAANEGLCPTLKSPVYKPSAEKSTPEVLSVEEQLLLEDFLLCGTNETKLGILLSLRCGLRIGEICALKWENIDLKNKIIRIDSTVARVKSENKDKTFLTIDRPKTKASVREIPITNKLFPVLSEMQNRRKSEYVISETENFVIPRTYEYRYHKILSECGVGKRNYHTLRHTFATRCVQAGVDVKTLSEILGHGDVSITLNTYVHPSMEMKRMQIEKVESFSA